MASKKYIQAIDRAVDILKLVGNSPGGLTLATISRLRGLPKQTTHSILQTLVHGGMLEKLSRPPLYRLGHSMDGLRRRRRQWFQHFLMRAVPIIMQLARETDMEVVLSEYTGGEIVGRIRVPRDAGLQPVIRESWRMSPYGTGLVFQAFMDCEELAEFRSKNPLPDHSEYLGSSELVDELLIGIRKSGWLAYVRDDILRLHVPILPFPYALIGTVSLLRKPFGPLKKGQISRLVDVSLRTAKEVAKLSAGIVCGIEPLARLAALEAGGKRLRDDHLCMAWQGQVADG